MLVDPDRGFVLTDSGRERESEEENETREHTGRYSSQNPQQTTTEAISPSAFIRRRAASFPTHNKKEIMESITLPLAELKPALLGLSKVVNKRPTLPVLGMIKIERTADGWIALTGTDLDCFATVRLEQPAEGAPFSVLVPLEQLQTSAKNCGKNESLKVRKLADKMVSIDTPVGSQWAETRCDSLPVAEFPATPKFNGDLVPLPDAVRTSLHEAMQCASTDETRLVLNGAYLDVSKKDCHCVVGTDGRHLYSSNSFTLPMKESVIIPMHRFLDWPEFNKDGEWRMKAGPNAENKEILQLQLSTRRWRFVCRQFDGNYPNWRQVVPDGSDTKTTLEIEDAEPLLQAIQRMPDHDLANHTIGLAVENGSVLLLGKGNKSDEAWFSVPFPNVKASGKDVRVNTNREQVAKALQFGLTRIEIIDPMSPLRFVQGGRQMVIMPVRVEDPAQPVASKSTAPTTSDTVKSDGPGEAKTVVSEPNSPAADTNPAPKEAPMPEQPATPPTGSKNNANGYNVEQLIDQTLTSVEELQEAFDGNVQSLTSLRATVKILQREHKASTKEVESLKKTLKGLQAVKL